MRLFEILQSTAGAVREEVYAGSDLSCLKINHEEGEETAIEAGE